MAQYDNLKDYFQGEHLELITNAIKEHLEHEVKSDYQIKAPVVRSLVCINDDANFNVEIELGILADIVEGDKSNNRSFILTITGNLERKFKDINVIDVRNINADDFPKDNLLSQFILPDLLESEVEHIGSEIFATYKKLGVFDDCQVSIERLIKIEPIFFSIELDDNCLGRIILTETDVKVDINNMTVSYHAIPGTILLNKKKYVDELDGSLIITIAHELVHWWFHQRFFKVLLLLGENHVDLKSSTDTVALNDSMTDFQKAICIAEWQANALAMRLAIPQSTVEAVIKRIASDPSTYRDNAGDRMQACVIEFARIYNVSCFVAKERLRQLGYNFVEGTILEYEENGKKIQAAPFYFKPDTLKNNETFVIYRENYERLLKENKEFAELIEKRYFVYTGYVVCFNHPKFIKLKISNGVIEYVLSDYAREHAEECCYKFKYTYISNHNSFTECTISQYLCRLEDIKIPITTDGDKDNENINAKQIKMIFDKIKEDKKKAEKTKAKMLLKNVTTFSDVLRYHKKQITGLTNSKIENEYGISVDTLKAYVAPKDSKRYRKPSLENMMLLCHAFRLEYDTAIDFLTKAKTPLDEDDVKHKLYDDLLRLTNAPINVWNEYLTENGFSHLKATK